MFETAFVVIVLTLVWVATSVATSTIWFVVPSYFVFVWLRSRRMKEAGLRKYRIREFAWRFYKEQAQQAVAARLDDHALFSAYALPDHTAQAKQVVAREILRRGYTSEQFLTWAPPGQAVTVPPTFRKRPAWSTYLWMVKAKAVLFQSYLVLVVVGIPLAFIAAALFTGITGNEKAFEIVAGMLLVLIIEFAVLCGVAFQKRALRILLLRPFGEKRMTKSLRRFVTRNVGRLGLVYTLSDRAYRPNVVLSSLMMIPIQGIDLLVLFVLSPFIRNSFGVATVKNERSFRRLERFLLRKFRPSYWSFLTGGQAFNIRSTDPWWKRCIQMLMHSCEIVVVDLSKVKEGTAWELNELRTRKMWSKCIFVVAEDKRIEAPAILAQHWGAATTPQIFVYRMNGEVPDQASFQACLEMTAAPHFAAK